MSDLPMAAVHDVRDASAEHPGWHVTARADHTLADVLHPSYLWHSASRMLPGQFVWIHHAKRLFFVHLYIVEIDPATHSVRAEVLIKREISPDALPVASIDDARVEWGGPVHKHRVVLGKDVLQHGFDTKPDAQRWLDEQIGKSGAKVAA